MNDKSFFKLGALFLAVLALDLITKHMAMSSLTMGNPIPFLGQYMRWTLAYNPGGAFGMRLGSANYYLITSSIVFLFLIYYIVKSRQVNFIAIPLSIVAGGAAGNIIDRLRFGEVVDFIDCEFPDISIGSYHMDRWPIFNIADMAVSCGIIATILMILIHSKKTSTEQVEDSEDSATTPKSV